MKDNEQPRVVCDVEGKDILPKIQAGEVLATTALEETNVEVGPEVRRELYIADL